jgi:quercetin dioxygenase-like cupin family protein
MFFDYADAVAAPAVPGIIRRTLVNGDRMMICEFTLEEGARIPAHHHPHEQVGYVASGTIELTVGGETRVMNAGDSYCARSDEDHSVVALKPSVVVDIFSPPRLEYR